MIYWVLKYYFNFKFQRLIKALKLNNKMLQMNKIHLARVKFTKNTIKRQIPMGFP